MALAFVFAQIGCSVLASVASEFFLKRGYKGEVAVNLARTQTRGRFLHNPLDLSMDL